MLSLSSFVMFRSTFSTAPLISSSLRWWDDLLLKVEKNDKWSLACLRHLPLAGEKSITNLQAATTGLVISNVDLNTEPSQSYQNVDTSP